jgi:arginase
MPLFRARRKPKTQAPQAGVVVLGAPLESESLLEGVNLMPAALRDAGLDPTLRAAGVAVADMGDLELPVTDHARDPITGILAYEQVCAATDLIRRSVPQLLDSPDIPLVVGGCCGILVGIFAALRERYHRAGLAFLDGHLDYFDGTTAPAGALGYMELRVLTGRGPRPLTAIVGEPPLLHATDLWALGFRNRWMMREAGAPDAFVELPDAHFVDDAGVRRHGPAEVGRIAADALTERPGRFWLHVDLDVLSHAEMPAVDDVVPGGLSWDELTGLLRPLVQSDALLGIDLTIYNPSRDPGHKMAPRIVRLLADVLETDGPG